jgi:osmoprotectant transport system ATP-binding protein
MIRLRNVSKTFNNTKAVNNISIDIEEGENMVLLGTSGCGKTTTLRMINRLTEPSEGDIIVNGQNVLQQQPVDLRKGIGYVLQHNGLFPHYTVAENIAVVPTLLKWNKERIQKRTIELLQKLHLAPASYLNVYPNKLSGGQQQRVGLARALAADPPILLMDEPFGALDPLTRNSIKKDFISLEEFKKKTIVLVTHDVQEAFELGDRICLMHHGEIVQTGTATELLFRPTNEFVQSFLQEQRFVLELQSITLLEILNDLPDSETTGNNVSVSEKTTLWHLLQLLSASKQPIIISLKTYDHIISKQVTLELLLSIYTKLKNRLA